MSIIDWGALDRNGMPGNTELQRRYDQLEAMVERRVGELEAENSRLREVERKGIELSEYIQTHGLTEYELALKDAEIKQLRAENERLRVSEAAI